MAWLEQKKSGQFSVVFRFGEEKFKRSLRTKPSKEARAAKSRIEENIRLVERGLLTLPEDADVVSFLLSDGRVPAKIPDDCDSHFHGGSSKRTHAGRDR